ncbi:uncharacterized protein LOC122394080 [Amphibalanus amphitrite]|uniref:uncharacterized protein LOC122394080 n=1 Tax=Amphibalanus amphitrite TaxID=1232801 RepID=UPI001C91F003|nr:uncharacterized protein LOC122394080 [Amphibalanus amphitrite]
MPGLVVREPVRVPPEPARVPPESARVPPEVCPPSAVTPTEPAPAHDPLMAGYQDCAAEAVRFLVEEEGRAPDDPTVVGLTEHLQARSAYLEYLSLLRRLEVDMEDQLEKVLRSPPERAHEGQLLSERQRRLVESVFRGCDLVLRSEPADGLVEPSPPPSPPSEPTEHPSRHRFHNNSYLDQVLSWAYIDSRET